MCMGSLTRSDRFSDGLSLVVPLGPVLSGFIPYSPSGLQRVSYALGENYSQDGL